jgi:hypothetical protein
MLRAFWIMATTHGRRVFSKEYAASRAAMSDAMKLRNAEPAFAAANKRQAKARQLDPDFCRRRSAASIKLNADPVFKAAASGRMRAKNADPIFSAKAVTAAITKTSKGVVNTSTGCIFKSFSSAIAWLKSQGKTKACDSYLIKCCKGKAVSAYGHTWRYATPEETAALKEKGASWAPLSDLAV